MASSSDISLSSDDEDDAEAFLTGSSSKNSSAVDREALVRQKLLESFYGKSAVAAAKPSGVATGADTDDDDDDDDDSGILPANTATQDLDSPHFSASAYLEPRIMQHSMQDLLENEEQLALQVRTLDSTMQTLVYENYSRFIDATDAIKSIGVTVQANEEGLKRLSTGMQAVEDRSRAIEEAVGSLRDQVAEKIRVKRLLTRLDTLLKLPQTLRSEIDQGKYRTATRSYLSAAQILSKHSAGFESLRTIETECTAILDQLKTQLDQKLLHWSGRSTDPSLDIAAPKSMTDIFECVGTLLMLQQNRLEEDKQQQDTTQEDEEGQGVDEEAKMDEFQSMAAAAALRLLDRTLDGHMIDVQERRYHTGPNIEAIDMKLGGGIETDEPIEPPGTQLVAKEFLHVMLEGSTLFAMTFPSGESASSHLVEFVSDAFSSFLYHTKSILMDETAMLITSQDGEEGADGYQRVAGALSILVHSVRELASGLALPEVGITPMFAAKLVDQATNLTESMVRRRVDQQFHTLRLGVVEDCLVPFASKVATDKPMDSEEGMTSVLQFANSTLSDCLQLVDDTIRSILAGGLELGEGPSPDLPDLKDAVEASTKRFAFWLADTLELLAGGESSDRNRVTDAAPEIENDLMDDPEINKMEESVSVASDVLSTDDLSEIPGQDDALLEKLDAAFNLLKGESDFVKTEYVLVIAEMCRMAEDSVADNLEQSIAMHLGGKKKSRGLFPSGEASPMKKGPGSEDDITRRFQLARSTVLVLYSSNRGSEAANLLCEHLEEVAHMVEPSSEKPSDFACKSLMVAKKTSLEFAALFGGSRRAGPVKEVEGGGGLPGMSSTLTARKTGLQLDVERMFKEKVPIYPHPSVTLEDSRDAVVFLLLKIAFRGLLEQCRMLRFSGPAYRQLYLDVEFLKHMVSHYISSDYHPGGSSACTALSTILDDCMDTVGDRCLDDSVLESREDVALEVVNHIRSFLNSAEESELPDSFIINED